MNHTLADLVEKLDRLSPNPSLVAIADLLGSTPLTVSDVSEYLRANRSGYHRAPVVSRPHYDLLVMTWLPGQSSVPHDHSESVCVMKVLQGEAVEESYRVAADGYVDLEYASTIPCNQVTAGQDAGVHAIRNPSITETLVTLHVYAPALRDFRRLVTRPEPRKIAPASLMDRAFTVVVIGGGFSGSSVSAQILRRASQMRTLVRVVMVERRGAVGEGVAYGTRETCHLLNVPAGRMSLWPDRPLDFAAWADGRYGNVLATDFLPRTWCGEYVRETVTAAAKEFGDLTAFSVVLDEVRRVARHPQGGWLVHQGRGPSLRADAVVVAVGHRPPLDVVTRCWSGPTSRLIADPWRPYALQSIQDDEEVLVLGTGLTAVDAVLSLAGPSRVAPITLLSRRGLLPLGHSAFPSPPVDLKEFVESCQSSLQGLSARDLLVRFRSRIKDHVAAGGDWRAVVDGLRPFTAALWRALSKDERTRFLRHLRPFWEVHRHRMAPAVAERFHSLIDQGIVRLAAGRIESVQAGGSELQVRLRRKIEREPIELRPQWIVNCTGPSPSNSVESNPVIGSLLVDGLLRSDDLRLGIETTGPGNPIDVNGDAVGDLFVIGTLRKPELWESTAVPELRQQAAVVAEQVVQMISDRLHASCVQDFTHAGI